MKHNYGITQQIWCDYISCNTKSKEQQLSSYDCCKSTG